MSKFTKQDSNMNKTTSRTIIIVTFIVVSALVFGPSLMQQLKIDTCVKNGGPKHGCSLSSTK
ncbi:hypothetical protein VPH219E481_0066 [Vibrio phage 219E48-1]|nr:hypothetical protein PODOV021v1_p0055 [Vibrio phage 219E41.2]QZI91079.1 hypothetical protein PODOV032v1_p0074 [Vibrio phage 219E41.1]